MPSLYEIQLFPKKPSEIAIKHVSCRAGSQAVSTIPAWILVNTYLWLSNCLETKVCYFEASCALHGILLFFFKDELTRFRTGHQFNFKKKANSWVEEVLRLQHRIYAWLHVPSNVRRPSSLGNADESMLSDKARTWRLVSNPNSEGTVPVSWLEWRYNSCKFSANAKDGGMVPVRLPPAPKTSSLRSDQIILSPGIEPVNLFS